MMETARKSIVAHTLWFVAKPHNPDHIMNDMSIL